MSGIDSIVGPRDEGAMSAPLPDTVDAEYLKLGRALAQEYGFRILLHDRINTGGSQFYLGRKDGSDPEKDPRSAAEYRGSGEPRLQAFFLRELMVATGFSRAFLWGSSAGAAIDSTLWFQISPHAFLCAACEEDASELLH